MMLLDVLVIRACNEDTVKIRCACRYEMEQKKQRMLWKVLVTYGTINV